MASQNDISYDVNEEAQAAGFVGGTNAEIRDADSGESVEWDGIDILNLWFARLAQERIGAVVLSPYATEITMPVDTDDMSAFLSDCKTLLTVIRDGGKDEDVPLRFQANGCEEYEDILDETPEEDLEDIIDDIETLLDGGGEEFVYEGWHEEYDPDDFDDLDD